MVVSLGERSAWQNTLDTWNPWDAWDAWDTLDTLDALDALTTLDTLGTLSISKHSGESRMACDKQLVHSIKPIRFNKHPKLSTPAFHLSSF